MKTPHSGLAETMQALSDGCVCDYCAAMRSRINDAVLHTSALHMTRAAHDGRARLREELAHQQLGPLREELAHERRARKYAQDRLDEILVERAALVEAFDAILAALEKTKLITVKR